MNVEMLPQNISFGLDSIDDDKMAIFRRDGSVWTLDFYGSVDFDNYLYRLISSQFVARIARGFIKEYWILVAYDARNYFGNGLIIYADNSHFLNVHRPYRHEFEDTIAMMRKHEINFIKRRIQ